MLLNFCICAPLQFKKNIIDGKVHKIFRSTSTWELYHEAMMINRLQWEENQHPEEWSSKVESETLRKDLGQKLYQLRRKLGQKMTSETRNPHCSCFNIEEIEVNCLETRFAASPRHKLCLRKLTIALPFLKSSFSRDLKSNVVYKLSCCGCNSSYARQTVQRLATKVEEHKKEDSSVGIHKRQ